MKLRKNVLVTPVALATLALVGCGGGGNSNTTASTSVPEPGQVVTASIIVDGKEVESKTYRVYAVADDDGTLTNVSLPKDEEAKRTHAVMLETSNAPMQSAGNTTSVSSDLAPSALSAAIANLSAPVALKDIFACYKDFWSAMKQQYPTKTRNEIGASLNKFDMSVDELCTYSASSGLTIPEYIVLFKSADKYFPNRENIEGDIAIFFQRLNVTPKDFQLALAASGSNWDAFLSRLSSVEGDGVNDFLNAYSASPLALQAFLAEYMMPRSIAVTIQNQVSQLAQTLINQMPPSLRAAIGKPVTYAQVVGGYDIKAITEAAKLGWTIAKDVWTVIQNNRGTASVDTKAVTSSILSTKEPNYEKYELPTFGKSKTVEFVGKSYFFNAWENYRTDLTLEMYYKASNPAIPGNWIPSMKIVDKNTNAGTGYQMTGTASVRNVVNMGSVASPTPEVKIDMLMTVNGIVSTVKQTYTFTANGLNGPSAD